MKWPAKGAKGRKIRTKKTLNRTAMTGKRFRRTQARNTITAKRIESTVIRNTITVIDVKIQKNWMESSD